MVSGFPDWQTPTSRGVSGASIDSTTFSGAITSGTTGDADFSEVSTGEEHFYQGLVITVPDDVFIHRVQLIRISDGFIWWLQDFVTAGSWEVPGFSFLAGEQLRVRITNNGDATLTFTGAVFTTKRIL